MFELFFLGVLVIGGAVFLLKLLFSLLGLVFAGVGIVLKMVLTLFFGLFLLPLGAVFSGGFFITVLVLLGLGLLIREKKPEGTYRD